MSMAIAIDINDAATPAMRRFMQTFERPAALLSVIGREAANLLRAHFRHKEETEPSALGLLGGRRQHFWLSVMRSVSAPAVKPGEGSVTVTVTDPRFGQKVYGGEIHAKRAKFLTIPVDPEAYGRRTSTFEAETGMKLIFIRQNNDALLVTKGEHGFNRVRYLLRRSVNQKPDPTALPDLEKTSEYLRDRARAYIDRQMKGPATS